MLSAVLDGPPIDVALAEVQAAGEADFRSLVRRFAEGEEVSSGELREILLSANRTQDDLRRLVDLARERFQATDDLRQSEELAVQLPGLQAVVESARAIVEAHEREHRESMAPLYEQRDEAEIAAKAARLRSTDLRRDALQVLNRTISPDVLTEFSRLSNVAGLAALRWQELKAREDRVARRLADAEESVKTLTDRIASLHEKPNTERAIANCEMQLAEAKATRAGVYRNVGEMTNAEGEAAIAREALDKYTAEIVLDWRSMSFT